jgi:hypothetical protein
MKVIKSVTYPEPIKNFRALMRRFMVLHEYIWEFKTSKYAIMEENNDDENSDQSIWSLMEYDNKPIDKNYVEKHAIILATGKTSNTTTIEFIDETWSNFLHYPPIGEDFLVLADEIIREFEIQNDSIPPVPQDRRDQITNKIESVEYSGSVANFRAWMDRFLAINKQEFDVSTRKYRISPYSPERTTTECWNVAPFHVVKGEWDDNSKLGLILAVEQQPNITTVEFLDGRCYQKTATAWRGTPRSEFIFGNAHLDICDPIGTDFVKIAEWITKNLKEYQVKAKKSNKPTTQNKSMHGNRLVKVDARKLLSGIESESKRKETASSVTNIFVAGDVKESNIVVGNENVVTITRNIFKPIYHAIEKSSRDETEKADLVAGVNDIESEVAKGEQVDESFLARRLRNLKKSAPDIADVALSALAGPGAAISTIAKKVAEKIKAEAKVS